MRCGYQLWKTKTIRCRGQSTFAPSPGQPGRRRKWCVSALGQDLIQASDYLDFSGESRVRISVLPYEIADSFQIHYHRAHRNDPSPRQFKPFPAHARGFLYYGPQPGLPLFAASLRLRCTPSPDLASFAAGHDLLLPNYLPWQILGGQAATSWPTLRAQLLREGHLTPQSIADWVNRLGRPKGRVFPELMLFALHQPIPVDFARGLTLKVFCGSARWKELTFPSIFSPTKWVRDSPFTGNGLARFELSQTDPHIVHLRILKIADPVAVAGDHSFADDVDPTPREGTLYHRLVETNGVVSVGGLWAYDLRRKTQNAEIFRLLVATYSGNRM